MKNIKKLLFILSILSLLTIFAPATAVNLYYAFADPSSRVAGYMKYAHSNNKLTLGAAADDKMVISGSGEVGIGTTAPLNKLQIDSGTGANSSNKFYEEHSREFYKDYGNLEYSVEDLKKNLRVNCGRELGKKFDTANDLLKMINMLNNDEISNKIS